LPTTATAIQSDSTAPIGHARRVLESRGLTVRLSAHHQLAAISLAIAPGESVVMVGESGVGKSTLLEALCGLRRPSSGTVSVAGNLAVVFQETPVFPELSVAENIRLSDFGTTRAQAPIEPEIAATLGDRLTKRWRHQAIGLSGGERRVLALCRAVQSRPDLLIIDEPTAGLDPARAARFTQQLLALQATYGFAMLVATHDYELAARVGTRLLLLTAEPPHLRELAAEIVPPRQRDEPAIERLTATIHAAARTPLELPGAVEPNGDGPNSRRDGMNGHAPVGAIPILRHFELPPLSLLPDALLGTMKILALALAPVGLLLGIFGGLRMLAATRQLDMVYMAPRLFGRLLQGGGGSTFVGALFGGTMAAALASRLGQYRLQRHRDTIVLAGHSPVVFWCIPAMLAQALCFPVFATGAVLIGALTAWWPMQQVGVSGTAYIHRLTSGFDARAATFSAAVLALHGALVALAAFVMGLRRKNDHADVGRDTTAAVLLAISAVIGAEALLRGGWPS